MKSFQTKYEWRYYADLPKTEQKARYKEQRKRHEAEFRKLYRQATAYIAKECHYKNDLGKSRTGSIVMGSHYSIWIVDDREWCKKTETETGKDYAIFETVIEIQVLGLGEVKRSLAFDAVMGIMGTGAYDEETALKWLGKYRDKEK